MYRKMEFGKSRDFSEFCEQLNEVRTKFQKWDSCEKTVALYYLMVGLPFANARFLQHALEQCIAAINTPEAQNLERQANDAYVVSSFLSENPQTALYLLLNHLPLLRPNNRETARCYLKTIRKVLAEFIIPPFQKIYNECVELMSYVYIHPAFDKEDKKSFKHLLKQVLNKVSPENFVHSPVNESGDESVSPHPEYYCNGKKRSNSLTPASVNLHETDKWSSQESLTRPAHKPRSYSLSSNDTSFFNNISSVQTSSSETRIQDILLMNNQPIMRSIMSWLKSLRLHKYSWIFNNLTYSQMLNLTEDTLSALGVTKGARHKLILSLQKLRERGRLLSELESDIVNGGDINNAMKKLKNILQSPLQVSLGEDLPSQFIRVMGKACTHLLMSRQSPDENIVLFNSLCERADSLEAFSDDHKKRLKMWREQLPNESVHLTYPQKQQTGHTLIRIEPSYTQKSSSYPNMQNNLGMLSHRHSIDGVTLQTQLYQIKPPVEPQGCTFINSSHSFNIIKDKPPVVEHNRSCVDIESSLESLCLQMMEHALGP